MAPWSKSHEPKNGSSVIVAVHYILRENDATVAELVHGGVVATSEVSVRVNQDTEDRHFVLVSPGQVVIKPLIFNAAFPVCYHNYIGLWKLANIVSRNFERLFEPFDILRGQISIPAGTYRGWDVLAQVSGAPHRRVSGGQLLRFRYEWGFFGGRRIEARIRPQVKINDSLSVDFDYALEKVNLPWGDFTSNVVNTRVNYALSNRWLTSTTVQHSSLDSLVNYRFRLNYIYRPGDDLFFIYNEGRNLDLDRPFENALLGRSLLLKVTHSFDY